MQRYLLVASLLVCLIVIPVSVSAQPVTFGTATNLGTGLFPLGIAVADFNLDNTPDLAVVNQGTNNVSIFLGNGTGGFTAVPASPVADGSDPRGIVAADFNGDAIPDLAVTNQASDTVSILIGSGDGSFSPLVEIPTGGINPFAIVAGDFNVDFNLDVAVINRASPPNLSILLGDGTGGFSPAAGMPVATGPDPAGIAVGTFNADGNLDLAVTSSLSNTVRIFLGDGTGGFANAGDYAGAGTFGIVAVDVNGDGNTDLAAPTSNSSVSVLLGDGTGSFSFAPGSPFAVGTVPTQIVAGDFNGDGRVDLTVTNAGGSNISVLIGDGAGGFAAPANFATGAVPTALAAADFNADGKLDVAVVNRDDNNVGVHLNTTCCFLSVTNSGGVFNVVTSSPMRIACGVDCTRAFAPGTPVTLTATPGSGFEFRGWSGACTGTSTCDLTMNADASVTATFGFIINPPTLPSGRTGALYNQALTPAAGNGPFTFLLESGTPPPGVELSTDGILSGTPTQTGSFAFTVMAFDEDGLTGSHAYTITIDPNPLTISMIPDTTTARNTPVTVQFIITDTQANPSTVSISGSSTDETLVPTANLVFGGMGSFRTLTITPAADQVGTTTITVIANDGSVIATRSFQLDVPADAPPTITGPGHARTRRNTPVTVPFTVGDAESGPSAVTLMGSSSNAALVPNANIVFGGSGASRTVTITPAANQIGTVTITLTASDGALSTIRTLVLRVSTTGVLGDLDGDGKADLTVYRPSTANWWSGLSSTNYTTYLNLRWGYDTDVPLPGDFDGDGRDDITVFRPSTGQWYVVRSSTNFMPSEGTNTYDLYQWGMASDIPVAGDYDGDGKADPAVFRPSTGQWYILQSSSNYTTFLLIAWGNATDTPVVADYDGDGRSDVAIYRPSTGQWYVLTSSSNFTMHFVFMWGASTDVAVPGDYDGDGKADLAVFRASTMQWYALLSSGNYTTYYVAEWGTTGDIPTPGDFDGDGFTDFAVYRPSTATWNVLSSSTGFTTSLVVSWGLATDIPALRRP